MSISPPKAPAQAPILWPWLAFTLAYVLAWSGVLPKPYYLPEPGEWTFVPPPGVRAMGFYGTLLVAGTGGVVGATWGRLCPPIPARLLRWTVALAFLAALSGIAITEFSTRGPIPPINELEEPVGLQELAPASASALAPTPDSP